jgi:hypothetical protein
LIGADGPMPLPRTSSGTTHVPGEKRVGPESLDGADAVKAGPAGGVGCRPKRPYPRLKDQMSVADLVLEGRAQTARRALRIFLDARP